VVQQRGEGAGVYFEEGWGWVADHDINTGQSLTVKNPRGMTVTGSGESWLYGTAMEHSFLWQYNFSGCGPVTTIVTQTETDYWSTPPSGWAMVHENARVQMYGSGWYKCVATAGRRRPRRPRARARARHPKT
jgi:hypothetical protein